MTQQLNGLVRVGQIWKDWDKRFRDGDPRCFEIVEIVGGKFAMCKNTETGRITRIAIIRLRPNATGYKLVSE